MDPPLGAAGAADDVRKNARGGENLHEISMFRAPEEKKFLRDLLLYVVVNCEGTYNGLLLYEPCARRQGAKAPS